MPTLIVPRFISQAIEGNPIAAQVNLDPNNNWAEFRVKIGRSNKPITLEEYNPSHDNSTLVFNFTTGKGVKFVRVQARCKDGEWNTLGCCLIFTRARQQIIKTKEPSIVPHGKIPQYFKIPKCSDAPLVTIIVPAYNQWEYTRACIYSIIKSEPLLDCEIIIADDHSTDRTCKATEILPGVIVAKPQQNLGFLRNCNHAAKIARGKFIYFLNNDTQITPGAISTLIDLYEKHPDAGIIGSKLIYPNGRLQEAGGILWKDATGWNYGRNKDPSLPEYNYLKESDYVSGASLMISKELWINVGGFSEEFTPAYYEDCDLAYKVRAENKKVYYQPNSVVVHFEGVSNGRNTSTGIKAHQTINQGKFFEKWGKVLGAESFKSGQNLFSARDRSRNRKTVVFIDHYIPMPDHDTGSRTLFQYIALAVNQGHNIKFIGANFNYNKKYAEPLEAIGVEILCGEYYRDNWRSWLKENANAIHSIFICRPHITEFFLLDLRKSCPNAWISYFCVDLHYLREEREFQLTKNPASLARSQDWKAREESIIEKTDCFLTISNDEERIIRSRFPDKPIVTFPVFYWENWDGYRPKPENRFGFIFVGGFSHLPNIDGTTWFLDEVWPLILQSIPEAQFNVVGSNTPEKLIKRSDKGLKLWGHVTDAKLDELYALSRVAVVPIRYGAGVKGKTIEAMRNGLPISATTIAIEGLPNLPEIIKPWDTPEKLAANCILLHENSSAWHAQCEAQFTYAKSEFNTKKAMTKLNNAIERPVDWVK